MAGKVPTTQERKLMEVGFTRPQVDVFNSYPTLKTDPLTGVNGLSGPDGSAFFGPVTSGAWMKVPSLFRLRFTGTGTAVMDTRNSLAAITLSVLSYTLTAATDQIEFPYAGDDAVNIRVTLTGTTTCEVI